jgi:prevent-host-death family protein
MMNLAVFVFARLAYLCYQFGEQKECAMEAFSVRDLRERSGDLVRQAEQGRLSLVSKHGHPLFVAVPLDEHLLEYGVEVALACRLVAEKVVSVGKGAKLARLPLATFLERLGAMGIAAVDYPADEIDAELEALS